LALVRSRPGCSTIVRARLFNDRPSEPAKQGDDFAPISKVALGLWRFSPQYPQLIAVDAAGEALSATHWGAYLLAEQSVYRIPESNRDVALFVRYGFTDGTTSLLAYSVSAGLSYRGPFAGREKDAFGIAATRAHVGPQGRIQLASDAGTALSSTNETVLQMTYRAQLAPGMGAQLAPGMVLQPVVQRVLNPALHLANAIVAGVRLQLSF